MVYLSKNARRVLKFLQNTPPNMPRGWYNALTLEVPDRLLSGAGDPGDLLDEAYERLYEAGALRCKDRVTFRMTDVGRNWRFYHWKGMLEDVMKSVFVPIVVSVITSIITTALSV